MEYDKNAPDLSSVQKFHLSTQNFQGQICIRVSLLFTLNKFSVFNAIMTFSLVWQCVLSNLEDRI
jgi:hypothetical protein